MTDMISEHFSVEEMACRCGCGLGREVCDFDPRLIEAIEAVHYKANLPMRVTSGARCRGHNIAEGGHEKSAHIVDSTHQGQAIDFMIYDNNYRAIFLDAIYSVGFPGVGIAKGFMHIDVRPRLRRQCWTY